MWCATGAFSRVSSLFYVNDLQFVSNVLDPILFAYDTNLFYSHKDFVSQRK